MNEQITIIEFISIDKNFYQLNNSNKNLLEQNANKKSILAFNGYVSDIAYDIIKKIIRRKMNLSNIKNCSKS
jgi:hypothetical protein